MTNEFRTSTLPDPGQLRESARQSFARDLPMLLREHLGGWVMYHGERQVGIARHTAELHETCRRQALSSDAVMLFEITPQDEEITFGPMAFD